MNYLQEKLENYLETYFEVVSFITDNLDTPKLSQLYQEGGKGELWTLARELTDEFEDKYDGKIWDGGWFDSLDEFLEEKINAL